SSSSSLSSLNLLLNHESKTESPAIPLPSLPNILSVQTNQPFLYELPSGLTPNQPKSPPPLSTLLASQLP
ncbi:unnamed protein product, partial [Prunus brigantina]